MKTLMIVLLNCWAMGALYAQQFSGLATYQSRSQVELSLDSTTHTPQQMQAIKQQILRKLQKLYTLKFDAKESLWEQQESVSAEPSSASSSERGVVISTGSTKDKLYRNLAEGKYKSSQEMMGKRFLITDTLPSYDWKIGSQTKKIGDYTCQKATYTTITEAKRFTTGREEPEAIQDTSIAEAWFTMDIPVAHGPAQYFGLPGLILEMKGNGRHFICTELRMNYTKTDKIEVPDKGSRLSKKDFDALSEEKMKEMMQRYRSKGDGADIEILIGG